MISDSNPSNVSISGRVIDETRNTLIIRHGDKVKMIAKKDAIFLLRLLGRDVEVEGRALVGRPEDRVKRKLKKRW